MARIEGSLPRAREGEMVVQELPDEVLVYDLKRHKAHCLNRSAARIWRHCDGRTTAAQMAKVVGEELQTPITEEAVWLALDRLGKASLLEQRVTHPGGANLSRREVVRKLGAGAALAVPVVMSITAPEAAQAQTTQCGQNGAFCDPGGFGSVTCCPGFSCIPSAGFPNRQRCSNGQFPV